jgi:hypothetical protein
MLVVWILSSFVFDNHYDNLITIVWSRLAPLYSECTFALKCKMEPLFIVNSVSKFLERVQDLRGKDVLRLGPGVLNKELSEAPTIVEEPNLWIDSLCIDQQDYAERGKKLCQMNQIYQDYTSRFEDWREDLAAFRAIIVKEYNRALQELDRMCVKEEPLPKFQMLMIQTELCNTSLRNREPHLTCTNTQDMRTKQEAENQ